MTFIYSIQIVRVQRILLCKDLSTGNALAQRKRKLNEFILYFESYKFLSKLSEDISILTNFYVCGESFLQGKNVGRFYLRAFVDVDTNLSLFSMF